MRLRRHRRINNSSGGETTMDKKRYDSDSLGGALLWAKRHSGGWHRRSFLKSLGLAAAGAAVGGPLSLR